MPDVDLMATRESRKVQRFYSWNKEDMEAEGLDSLAGDVNWMNWQLPYIFPPVHIIPAVLVKMKEQNVPRVILVAPWRTGDLSHPVLMGMTIGIMRIPHAKKLVGGIPLRKLEPCHLCDFWNNRGGGEN